MLAALPRFLWRTPKALLQDVARPMAMEIATAEQAQVLGKWEELSMGLVEGEEGFTMGGLEIGGESGLAGVSTLGEGALEGSVLGPFGLVAGFMAAGVLALGMLVEQKNQEQHNVELAVQAHDALLAEWLQKRFEQQNMEIMASACSAKLQDTQNEARRVTCEGNKFDGFEAASNVIEQPSTRSNCELSRFPFPNTHRNQTMNYQMLGLASIVNYHKVLLTTMTLELSMSKTIANKQARRDAIAERFVKTMDLYFQEFALVPDGTPKRSLLGHLFYNLHHKLSPFDPSWPGDRDELLMNYTDIIQNIPLLRMRIPLGLWENEYIKNSPYYDKLSVISELGTHWIVEIGTGQVGGNLKQVNCDGLGINFNTERVCNSIPGCKWQSSTCAYDLPESQDPCALKEGTWWNNPAVCYKYRANTFNIERKRVYCIWNEDVTGKFGIPPGCVQANMFPDFVVSDSRPFPKFACKHPNSTTTALLKSVTNGDIGAMNTTLFTGAPSPVASFYNATSGKCTNTPTQACRYIRKGAQYGKPCVCKQFELWPDSDPSYIRDYMCTEPGNTCWGDTINATTPSEDQYHTYQIIDSSGRTCLDPNTVWNYYNPIWYANMSLGPPFYQNFN